MARKSPINWLSRVPGRSPRTSRGPDTKSPLNGAKRLHLRLRRARLALGISADAIGGTNLNGDGDADDLQLGDRNSTAAASFV